jgi:hypothetical protein
LKDPPKPFQLLDSLSSFGLLLFLQPQARFFMLLDLTPETLSNPHSSGTVMKGKQIASNPTVAITKLGSVPIGVLSIVDMSALPDGTHIEKLVALSPTLWIVETNDQRRFMSRGPSGGWKWRAVDASESQGDSFVAHEHGWFHTPVANVIAPENQERNNSSGENIAEDGSLRALPRRCKPLEGTPMDYLNDSASVASAAPVIPAAQAIFIPRQSVAATPAATPSSSAAASSSATTTAILNAFQRNSALLTPPPPSSLYRFAAGALFDGATAPANASSIYEVPFPSLITNDKSTTAEATYHSWLSTLIPQSSQLAMPSYFTYHLPPPAADATGPYISKVEQPVLSLIDLYGRRIAHIPIRPHPSDTAAASRAQAKISVEKFMTIGHGARSGSSFRSRSSIRSVRSFNSIV